MSITPERKRTLVSLPQLRGGADVIERAMELGGDDIRGPFSRLAEVATGLDQRGLSDRVIFDLGLVRDLGYYTGAIFEVYDPALGHVIGGGGRYDDLLGRFGRPLPACGFALFVERMHVAQAEEERLGAEGSDERRRRAPAHRGAPRRAVRGDAGPARRRSGSTPRRCGPTRARCCFPAKR